MKKSLFIYVDSEICRTGWARGSTMARAFAISWSLGPESNFDETNLLMMEFSVGMSLRCCSWGWKKRCGSLTKGSSRTRLPYLVFHSETSFSAIWVWDKKTDTSSGAGEGIKRNKMRDSCYLKIKVCWIYIQTLLTGLVNTQY